MPKRFPKELVVARVSKRHRLAQVVLKINDVVGAMAEINSITAGEGVDIRQSVAFSIAKEKYAVYDAFVVLPQGYELKRLVEKLKKSASVLGVIAKDSVDGAIVDTVTFPIMFAGEKVVLLGTSALVKMFESILEAFGTGGSFIIYQQGMNYGKALTSEIAKTVTRPYLIRNYQYGIQLLQAMGWGMPTIVKSNDDLSSVTVRVQECFECQGRKSDKKVGFFMAGLLAGIFSFLSGKELQGRETACTAVGDDYCEFVVS